MGPNQQVIKAIIIQISCINECGCISKLWSISSFDHEIRYIIETGTTPIEVELAIPDILVVYSGGIPVRGSYHQIIITIAIVVQAHYRSAKIAANKLAV